MMRLATDLSKYSKIAKYLIFLLSCLLVSRCVEPFDIKTENFESILVVNTTITDEVKKQQIILSRSFRFEENGPLPEQRAIVKVIEDSGLEYLFEEVAPGNYVSTQEFGVSPGKEYQLSIKTLDESSFVSDRVTLPQITTIENIRPTRLVNDDGIEGVGILVDTFDPTGNSVYYRYEYEETYRIRAPFWREEDLIAVPVLDSITFETRPRPEGEKICYKSNFSNNISLVNTSNFVEDRITGFEVKFIDAAEMSVADRYSILVRQYVQSREANGFYKVLSNFSGSESLFSQIQPGFITGNIFSESDPDEKVLGFFDVSSVSEKRVFFNRDELLEDLPRFSLDCDRIIPTPRDFETFESFLIRLRSLIESGSVKYVRKTTEDEPGFYVFVPRPCGDCTVFGKSTVPDFWVD